MEGGSCRWVFIFRFADDDGPSDVRQKLIEPPEPDVTIIAFSLNLNQFSLQGGLNKFRPP